MFGKLQLIRVRDMNILRALGGYLSQLGVAFALLWVVMFIITFSDSVCSPEFPI